jgi:hypothetical protein
MKLTEMFRALPGDTRDQLVSKMEVLLSEMKGWAKNGYEHEPDDCSGARKVAGEMRGGWVQASNSRCDRCGHALGGNLSIGPIQNHVDEFEAYLQQLRELPEDYRYQMVKEHE